MEPTDVALRWHSRSITRRYDEDIEQWAPDSEDEKGFRVSIGARLSATSSEDEAPGTPMLSMRAIVLIDEPPVSVKLDCAVKFTFGDAPGLSPPDVAEFAAGLGTHYILGYMRGALADLSRSVGMPSILLPTSLPEQLLADVRAAVMSTDLGLT